MKKTNKLLAIIMMIISMILLVPASEIQASEKNAYSSDIPSGVVEYNGHSYKLYEAPMVWEEAKKYCEKLGGHLVSITSEGEQKIINQMLEKGNKNSYFIGAQRDANGEFNTWVTGEKIKYTHYAIYQPDNWHGEDVLMVYRNENPNATSSALGEWNDIKNDGTCEGSDVFGVDNFGFICEWDELRQYLTLSENNIVLYEGMSSSISYKVAPKQGVTYSSDNTKVAKVDEDGNIECISAGTAIITAEAEDGQTADCLITVITEPKKVTLNKTKVTMKVGSKYTLKGTISPTASAEFESLTWTSNNKQIATVSKSGIVTAKKKGACTITVKTSNGKKSECKIIVK